MAQSILLYVKLVVVLGTKNLLNHYQLRVGLISWLLLLVVVPVLLGPTHDSYVTETTSGMETRAGCFPQSWPLYLGVITPFAIVYTFNLVVFTIILVTVLRRKNKNEKMSSTAKKMKKAFIALVLTLMFGIGWIFGILGSDEGNAPSILIQFVFIIIVGCHGLFVFLLYPCRSKDARDQWKKWCYYVTCRRQLYEERNKVSIQRHLRDRPSQHSSSTPLSMKAGSLEYVRPSSSNFSTSFANAGFLPAQPPSPDVQHEFSDAEGLKKQPTVQASALDSIEEDPTAKEGNQSPTHSTSYHRWETLQKDVQILNDQNHGCAESPE